MSASATSVHCIPHTNSCVVTDMACVQMLPGVPAGKNFTWEINSHLTITLTSKMSCPAGDINQRCNPSTLGGVSIRASLGYTVEIHSKTNHSVSHFGWRSVCFKPNNPQTWSKPLFLLNLSPSQMSFSQQSRPGFVALQAVWGATLG